MNINRAFITGASSGIGKAFAYLLAEEGYDLVLTARRLDRLNTIKIDLESQYGIEADVFQADLSDQGQRQDLINYLDQSTKDITVFINNAGLGKLGDFTKSPWKEQYAMVEVNITAMAHLAHYMGKRMGINNKGYILNVSSTAAFQPGPRMAVYYASKAFVLNFSAALAFELRDRNVTVTALCPGPTKTEFQDKAKMNKTRLFTRWPKPEAHEVARYGYEQLFKGRVVAVQGWYNQLLVFMTRFLPRRTTTAMAYRVQSNEEKGT